MKHYTITQAAAILGITRAAAWYHVRLGHLKAKRVGFAWIVAGDDLKKFKNRREAK